jgi:hypothetical protein
MSSMSMSRDEREAFVAGVHVGVLSVNEEGRGPLTVPVWYSYEPGGEIRVLTGGTTRKAELLSQSGRASLCVQTEAAPYAYVSVEGPVAIDDGFDAGERKAMAERYLGPDFGALYLAATEKEAAGNVTVRLTPEHWLAVDYSKQFG